MRNKSFPGKALDAAKRDYVSFALAAAVLLPGFITGFILYTQRLPFPYQDDYKALLAFAYQFDHAPNLSAKLLQISLVQYNFYRLIFEHVVVAIEVTWTHHLNFSFLTGLGDFFLAGIFGLLWCSFEIKPLKQKLLYFLPVSLLFFSLTYWETLNWTMAALQNLPVIFFALLSLYCLSPRNASKRHMGLFFLSCIAALLSCCSSPNGFLLAPVGVLMLASRRQYKSMILWLSSFILPLVAYLYHPATGPAQHVSHFSQLFYFLAFFGGALSWHPLAFLVGIALLAVFLWAARSHFVQQSPVLFPFSLWIVLTGALVETIRASINSRYSIYSVLMLVCSYVFLLRGLDPEPLSPPASFLIHIERRYFLRAAIAFSLCFYAATAAWANHHLHMRREMVLRGLRFYRANPLTNSPQVDPIINTLYPDEKPFELLMLHKTAKDGLYTAPSSQNLAQ